MDRLNEVRGIVWHHSATAEGSVTSFRVEHKKRKFEDIGYHYLIGNGHGEQDGAIIPGRDLKFQGAGVWGNNRGFIHVCVVGNFEKTKPTARQLQAIGTLQLKLLSQYDRQRLTIQTHGHREVALKGHGTLCPGKNFPLDALRAWLKAGNFRTTFSDFLAARETLLARKSAVEADAAAATAAVAAASAPAPALVEPEGVRPQGRDCMVRTADGSVRRVPAIVFRDRTYFAIRDLAIALGYHVDYNDGEVILHVP